MRSDVARRLAGLGVLALILLALGAAGWWWFRGRAEVRQVVVEQGPHADLLMLGGHDARMCDQYIVLDDACRRRYSTAQNS
jgi:hypothetical protein